MPQLRKELAKLAPALIAEHGKDIQHSPASNPTSGFSTPTYYPHKAKADPAGQATQTSTSATGKVSINTTTVTASDEFRTSAEELYNTFTDRQRITSFTRASPKEFEGAHEGGKFAIFDGNVTGEFVKLERPKIIVQRWRLAQWPEGHFSTQEIFFDQNNVDGVTVMRVTWSGVPVGQEEVVQRNWEIYYVRSIKQTFGYVDVSLTYLPVIIAIRLIIKKTSSMHSALPTVQPSSSISILQILIFALFLAVALGLARYSDYLLEFI